MKKFIALAIAVVMLATLALPTFAATSGSTTVKYTVGETYTLTVPAEITVGDETTNDITSANIKSKISAIEKAAEKARGLLIKENPDRTIFSDYQMTSSSHLTY